MDAKITNSNENKANPVNYSTQGFTGDPILALLFFMFCTTIFAQGRDYINEMEQNDLQIRQKPKDRKSVV